MLAKTFIASAIIGAVVATPQPAPEPMIEIIQVRQLLSSIIGAATSVVGAVGGSGASSIADAATSIAGVATSFAGEATGCVVPDSILSIITAIPTAPAELGSALVTVTNVCVKPSFTGRISSEYDSYSRAVSSWASQNSQALDSWQSDYKKNCPLASNIDVLSTTAGICSTTVGASNPASTSRASTSGNTSGNGTSGSTGTGSSNQIVVVGAVFFAGLAGVLAVL